MKDVRIPKWHSNDTGMKCMHALCYGRERSQIFGSHTWEVQHFIQVLRVTRPNTMDCFQFLKQFVPLCLCLLQTFL